MSFRFSIGVVTYLGRFDTYFKHLMRQLNFIFPDYDIIVFLNGHHDLEKQICYVQEATAFLSQYSNVRYLTNVSHQPLTRGWNWLVLMASCEHILILNDDVTLNAEFRHNLERLDSVPDISTINGSWSHFIISKQVVRQVGWFDEKFSGIGYEDYDYIFRLARRGIQVKNLMIHGILSYVAPATDASWAKISEVTAGKYSKTNYDYFRKKWSWSEYGEVPPTGAFKVYYEPYGQEWLVSLNEPLDPQQDYYPRESLSARSYPAGGTLQYIKGQVARVISGLNSLYWTSRLQIAAYLRSKKILGPWWDRWRGKITE